MCCVSWRGCNCHCNTVRETFKTCMLTCSCRCLCAYELIWSFLQAIADSGLELLSTTFIFSFLVCKLRLNFWSIKLNASAYFVFGNTKRDLYCCSLIVYYLSHRLELSFTTYCWFWVLRRYFPNHSKLNFYFLVCLIRAFHLVTWIVTSAYLLDMIGHPGTLFFRLQVTE